MIQELKDAKEKFGKIKRIINVNAVYYLGLIITLIIGFYIRTRNLKYLGDKYLIGLDPDLFYRYSEYIIQHGSLMARDMMRYFPTGYVPSPSDSFFAYTLAYAYKLVAWTGATLKEVYIIYPVVAGLIGIVFLFLFMRELFGNKVAIITAAFTTVIPAFIFRTGAGFADHDAMGVLWFFMALYFFALAWRDPKTENTSAILKLFPSDLPMNFKQFFQKYWKNILFAVLSGTFTGFMILTWGVYRVLLAGICLVLPLSLIFSKIKSHKIYLFFIWALLSILFVALRFESLIFLQSPDFALLGFVILTGVAFLAVTKFSNRIPVKITKYFSTGVLSLLVALVLSIFGALIVRFDIIALFKRLLYPGQTSRLGYTISENMTPYFKGGNGWEGNFGFTVWVILISSILLFYFMFRRPLKYSLPLTGFWTVTMFSIILGNYAPGSKINSIFAGTYMYILVAFALTLAGIYFYTYIKDKEAHSQLFNTSWQLLLIFALFIFSLFITKRMIRLIFSFVPIAAMVLGVGMGTLIEEFWATKRKILVAALCILLIICFVGNTQSALEVNRSTGPGVPGQWETALNWIKENTPENAVFAHWWDYGYWLQTLANRATVVDGGNDMGWDHYMGREGILGKNPDTYLSYFKTFGITHLLISGEEIGKFSAFSTIGSDENMDLQSTIGVFNLAETQETRDGVRRAYSGGWGLDQDYVFNNKVFGKDKHMLAGVVLDFTNDGKISTPMGIMYDGTNQYSVPISCVCANKMCSKVSNNTIINGCFILIPSLTNETSGDLYGAGLFVSEKIVDTNFVQMYLLGIENQYFKEVYNDGTPMAMYRGNIVAPIKIWEVLVPENVETNSTYLETSKYG